MSEKRLVVEKLKKIIEGLDELKGRYLDQIRMIQEDCEHPKNKLFISPENVRGESVEVSCRECGVVFHSSRAEICLSCFGEMKEVDSVLDGETRYECCECGKCFSRIVYF